MEEPGTLILGPREPKVMIKVGGQSMILWWIPEANIPLTTPVAPFTGWTAIIVGATGDMATCSFCKAHSCQLGGHLVTHEFLYLPECPIPLLGRDLLTKLGAQITFAPRKPVSLALGSQSVLMNGVYIPQGGNK